MKFSKNTFFVLVSFFGIFSLKAQNLDKFKKELAIFQDSMYIELSGFDYDALRNDSVFAQKGIDKKIESFILKYKKEILAYKSETLKKYLSKDNLLPDLKAYQLDTNYSDFSVYEEYFWGKEFWDYTKIELMGFIGSMTMMIQSRYLDTSTIAEISYKNALARPLIFTQEKQPDQWHIWVDKYDYVFELEYDLQRDNFSYCKIYSRIK